MSRKSRTTRREFIRRSVGLATLPLFVPASVLGLGGAVPPSERITMAGIGVGGRGRADLNAFHRDKRVQLVALCDVDAARRPVKAFGLDEKAACGDFREVLARDDIDTVMVGTPDHWHALISIAAIKAGKDVYCEKPLSASVAEGRAVADAIREHRSVLQCGTQRRSAPACRYACEIVQNGRIGKLKRVEVGVPAKFAIRGGYTGLEAAQSVPEGFDYRMWLGPAPDAPYTAARCHFNFRWVLDYAPGYITDWGAHYMDVAQWGLGADAGGPTAVHAKNVRSREKGIYDAPESYEIEYTYAGGATAIMISGDPSRYGMKFIGEKGSVFVETQKIITEPESLATTKIGPDEIHLYESTDHHRNFIDCVRSRKRTAATAEIGHRSATVCHIGTISALLGRKLRWDPQRERFEGDDEANRRLERPMRSPWTLG